MANPKVHNVHFYKPKPKPVYCMALEPQENKLAVSRSDASIEIWNLTDAAFIERRIASSTENFSIEGLAWCGTRLFSVGLHGLLVEYDLFKLDIRSRAVVTGEAAFCLDVNRHKTKIAIGTEQGYLNIFQINEDEVLFEKFLDKQEGRILCLKFDQTGDFIVSGSMDAIRVWNVNTNQALHRMITGRSEQKKPTIVWCLAITSEFTIISGDSRGILTVWDGKVGAQLESYQSHRADILSLTLSEDENTIFCGGVDPNLVSYVRVEIKDGAHKWIRSLQRKIHDHDVRALVLNANKLYSSGVDGYLACSYHPPKTLLKYPPLLPVPCVTVSKKSRYLLLRYPKFLEVYSLGVGGSEKEKHTGFYPLQQTAKKLVVLQKVVKTDEGQTRKEGITCAAISNGGDVIMYSTRLGVRLLRLTITKDKPQVAPLKMLNDWAKCPCVSGVFAQDNRLITAPSSGGLHVIEFDDFSPVLVQKIDTRSHVTDTITLLVVSNSAQYLVGGDVKGNIAVWIWKEDMYHFHCKLPKYNLFATAAAIHPNVSNLVVAYSNNKIIEYNLDKKELTKFSRSLNKNPPKQWTSKFSTIRNITFDPKMDHVIILHDDDSVIVIDKEKELEKEVKVPKINDEKNAQGLRHTSRSIKKYKHLVHLSWLSDDEMVAVEVSPLSLVEQLPPCFVQNTFGRK